MHIFHISVARYVILIYYTTIKFDHFQIILNMYDDVKAIFFFTIANEKKKKQYLNIKKVFLV